MAGRGPAPKQAHLRQRTNQKVGATVLTTPRNPLVPEIPNPDDRGWHPLTVKAWERAWRSPLASAWADMDFDAIGRLAVLWDDWAKAESPRDRVEAMKEIRQQGALFGGSPLDRSRLQWHTVQGEEAENKRSRTGQVQKRTGTNDTRHVLTMVK